MFPHTYRAYWREQGATDWNETQSPSPITWNTELIPGQTPLYTGGGNNGVEYQLHCEVYTKFFADRQWQFYWNPIILDSFTGTCSLIDSGRRPFSCSDGESFYEPVATRSNAAPVIITNGCFPVWPIRNARFIRVDGQPDNSGPQPTEESCITTFSTGLIVTRPECIEVALNPPDECPCCKELLPKTNSILSRLG